MTSYPSLEVLPVDVQDDFRPGEVSEGETGVQKQRKLISLVSLLPGDGEHVVVPLDRLLMVCQGWVPEVLLF